MKCKYLTLSTFFIPRNNIQTTTAQTNSQIKGGRRISDGSYEAVYHLKKKRKLHATVCFCLCIRWDVHALRCTGTHTWGCCQEQDIPVQTSKSIFCQCLHKRWSCRKHIYYFIFPYTQPEVHSSPTASTTLVSPQPALPVTGGKDARPEDKNLSLRFHSSLKIVLEGTCKKTTWFTDRKVSEWFGKHWSRMQSYANKMQIVSQCLGGKFLSG